MIESQLLSKVVNEGQFYELRRYNVQAEDFPTLGHVYEFVNQYVQENGSVPDYRTVVAEFADFQYIPDVTDTFKYLCTKLKADSAKRKAYVMLQERATKKFLELQGDKFVQWLKQETEAIERETSLAIATGTDYATNGAERLEWYNQAKQEKGRQFIPTPYPTLTEALGGGFEVGDYVLLMAFTNRGKSWIASDIGLAAWSNGFPVLHYSPELSKRQQALRLDTLRGHFDNVQLRRGQLDDEGHYREFLRAFTEGQSLPSYIIKTMEDLPNGLSVDVIEADLQVNPGIKLVIIDGFNLMVHGKGAKMRDAMTLTSRRLRQIFGRYRVAGLVVHQTPGAAEKDNKPGEDGVRIIRPPKLTDYSETIAVIQDAATALTFDADDRSGKLSIEKAREPKVGTVIDLNIHFNRGYIREQDITELF
jgi:replicative DNA helicase